MNYGISAHDLISITQVFAAYPQVQQAILFGSRAMGNYKPGSDIDLALTGNGLSFNKMLDISIDLENLGMLYTFDLQNMDTITDPNVKAQIIKNGQLIYPAS